MLEEIEAIHRHLHRDGAIFSHTGNFSQQTDEEFCETLDAYVKENSGARGLQTRVFSVFVEISQNIRKYFGEKVKNPEVLRRIGGSGTITVEKIDQGFRISSANLIEAREAEALVFHLEAIRRLSPEAMKKVYRDTLRDKSAGADSPGLGFLDIAKKTSGQFTFRMEPVDQSFTCFYFGAVVVRTGGNNQ